MSDIKPYLEEFYKTGKWQGEFENKIKGAIVSFVSREGLEQSIRRILGDNYLEDIYSTFVLKLLSNKELILSKPKVNFSYLTSMIKNTVMDLYRKKSFAYEVSVQSLQDTEEEGKLEEVIFRAETPDFTPLEVYELLRKVINLLDDKDKETLCYYIAKELGEDFEVKSLSRDALYKRWERLKKKLREILEEVNEELWKSFVDLYMSEVCRKMR
ncbi:sigma-70 family RNA polymerase sigma factor [Aquifex sp.]